VRAASSGRARRSRPRRHRSSSISAAPAIRCSPSTSMASFHPWHRSTTPSCVST
jgi:hypothetical protein